MIDGCDMSFFTTQIINHIFQQHNINIVVTGNKSLLNCFQSTKLISNKWLRAELHALHQMHEKN